MSGKGAYLNGSRWNRPRRYVVYVSGNLSLAMLEVLVHVDDAEAFLNKQHIYHCVSFDESQLAILEQAVLPASWNARPETIESQAVGDEWLDRAESVVLAVPSVVVPSDFRYQREYMNYLVNPKHPDCGSAVTVGDVKLLDWDPRLKQRK